MKNHVADQDDNNTRFIIFKNQPANLNELSKQPLDTNHFKAPLFVTPSFNDQPGTLYKILGYFAKAKLNLITLMSLPTKTELGVYSFYIEVSGTRDQQEEIFATLKELASTYHVHLLGFYAV
ncbi:prephenate dehydratase, partial [Lactiplantibacillus plantarum]|nr:MULTISPECIES: hypothetical protein [Lactiplantibacillus]KRL96391.1 prephenate dehydrotase [Lactiplantibacillus argentoratensis DSM 16365]QHM51275.1 hypothetical protein C7M40_03256 [Lactiplantibacillus plantarum]GEO54511.1 hypothetical protein LPL03_26070 [Lactiplantibacillus argentoratensis]